MTGTLAQFNELTDAEQYFQFFDLPYDAKTVDVNRLHILKQFSNAIKSINKSFPELGEAELLDQYRSALVQAYDLFQASSAVEQKLFKVFNDQHKNVVTLSQIGGL